MAEGVENLRKELANKAKQYEVRLATITTINNALQSENEELRERLDQAEAPKTVAEEELNELREEFARRLGALDRNVAELKTERENLRFQLEEESEKTGQAEGSLAAKENEVKKLRGEVKKLTEAKNSFNSTAKKAKSAKHELEGEKEALAARVAALEFELSDVRAKADAQAEESATKISELRNAADEAERSARNAVLKADSEALEKGEQLEAAVRERESMLMSNLQAMRADYERSSFQWEQKEKKLKREVADLEGRIQEYEIERVSVQSQASDCTKPLLKQLEAVMAASEQQQIAAQENEEKLRDDLSNSLTITANLQRQLQEATGRIRLLQSDVKSKVEALSISQGETVLAKKRGEEMRQKVVRLEGELDTQNKQLNATQRKSTHNEQMHVAVQRDLGEKLEASRTEVARLKAEVADLVRRVQALSLAPEPATPRLKDATPPPDQDQNSSNRVPDNVSRDDSAFDSEFEDMFKSNKGVGMWGKVDLPTGVASDSEAATLAKKLEVVERDRERVAEELCGALTEVKVAKDCVADRQSELAELQNRHDVALELLGERNEKVEQLELDIVEMKDIFHQQLQVCVDQMDELKAAAKTNETQ
ncbi:hypothetical protein BSKO_03337 [Bryopsis sp. KO-2023]|nr:hypothetical protein BSKO_03337 [Bryopsis sp. KO-2023]